jgi:IS5 family transposase
MRREVKRLKTYLGRVYRDVGRKIAGDGERQARFARLLGLVERLLAQQPKDKNKLYSLHAPEVVCIAKGKAHKRYEFGCKVGIAATNREGLFLAAKAFEDNPYDGHTLQATIDQAEAMSGVAIRRAYVDKGYRGHDLPGPGQRHPLGAKTGAHTPNETRTQATIGHRADDWPRQERRQAWQKLSARSPWRQDQRAPGGIRPQPAPHPQQTEASFCPASGCPP